VRIQYAFYTLTGGGTCFGYRGLALAAEPNGIILIGTSFGCVGLMLLVALLLAHSKAVERKRNRITFTLVGIDVSFAIAQLALSTTSLEPYYDLDCLISPVVVLALTILHGLLAIAHAYPDLLTTFRKRDLKRLFNHGFLKLNVLIAALVACLFLVIPTIVIAHPTNAFLELLREIPEVFYIRANLTNESAGVIFASYIILFSLLSNMKLRDALITMAIFIPLNFFLNVFRLFFILVFRTGYYDFNQFLFSIVYYVVVISLFCQFLAVRFGDNLGSICRIRVVRLHWFKIEEALAVSPHTTRLLKKASSSAQIIVIVLFAFVLGVNLAGFRVPCSGQPSVSVFYSDPPCFDVNGNVMYFGWKSEGKLRLASYSTISDELTWSSSIDNCRDLQIFQNTSSGEELAVWIQYQHDLFQVPEFNFTSFGSSPPRARRMDSITSVPSSPPAPIMEFVNTYASTSSAEGYPIFLVNYVNITQYSLYISFNYSIFSSLPEFLKNSPLLYNDSSSSYQFCSDNNNQTFLFFQGRINTYESQWFYSIIRDRNFTAVQNLSNWLSSGQQLVLPSFAFDGNNVLYIADRQSDNTILLYSNKSGNFTEPTILFNFSVPVSPPECLFRGDGTGYIICSDRDGNVHFFGLDNESIAFHDVFKPTNPRAMLFTNPGLHLCPDGTIGIFWRRILDVVAHCGQHTPDIDAIANDIAFTKYLSNGQYAPSIYVSV
jgi:hypothetical protein